MKGLMKRKTMAAAATALLAMLLVLCSCANASSGAAAPIRDSVNDYSWSELSAISDEIAAAGDDAAALAVAKRYHLVGDDGTLDGSQSKEVNLANGNSTNVVVVGFNHDEVAGGKKAGITFMFADAVALHQMNDNAGYDKLSETINLDTPGGWNASEMRGWLNGEFANELPADLRAALRDVVKSSLVVPESETEIDDAGVLLTSVDALIGQGVDKLWLPALVELTNVKDNSETAQAYPEWTSPLKAEGSQYQLFADAKASERQPNDVLARRLAGGGEACRWWLRSVEDWTYAEVLEDGAIDRRNEVPVAATPQGVVPCFSV